MTANTSLAKSGRLSFPIRLHKLLTHAAKLGIDNSISWDEKGTNFVIHDQKLFVSNVLPNLFKQSQFSSFRRQLNAYGFERVFLPNNLDKSDGTSILYTHDDFKRDDPNACKRISRRYSNHALTKGLIRLSKGTAPDISPEGCTSNTAHVLNPSYADASAVSEHKSMSRRKPCRLNFPTRLHGLLTQARKFGVDDIISWNEEGTMFIINNEHQFVSKILSSIFKQSKFSSFRRQLNAYGFERVPFPNNLDKSNGSAIIYSHADFKRDDPSACKRITRQYAIQSPSSCVLSQLQEDESFVSEDEIIDNIPSFVTTTSGRKGDYVHVMCHSSHHAYSEQSSTCMSD
eukprot:CAMPEP_0194225738 /NCGR_PEP_ID=MMETSP0156-20130528/40233_1 /TAXON_ID=33649 /ORGANISM="Thalassionema nitzschioides, Strain L26-B" /LENGTH=343 /DNA_ID=CAMNT_0038957805 /DNA_START=18 /DNA_END=1046 /DNA_ORIENTATION=-